MLTYLARRRDARIQADTAAVLAAIRMLRPSCAGGYPIGRLARISPGRVHVALARLEREGRVTSEWTPGPAWPRRRVYRIVREVAE